MKKKKRYEIKIYTSTSGVIRHRRCDEMVVWDTELKMYTCPTCRERDKKAKLEQTLKGK